MHVHSQGKETKVWVGGGDFFFKTQPQFQVNSIYCSIYKISYTPPTHYVGYHKGNYDS